MKNQNGGNGGGGASKYALTVRRAANLPADMWSDERIAAVSRTVAPKEAGPAEVAMFLAVANRYGLDPFLREIWLAKDKGRLQVLTGRDSFLKIARKNPDYRGYRAEAIYEKDEFAVEYTDDGPSIMHKIQGWDRGRLVAAFSCVYVEGRPPVLIIRRLDDYKHLLNKDNWKQNPEDMLLARVITASHRLAFSISGMYTPDEAGDIRVDTDDAAVDSVRASDGTRVQLEELKAKLRQKQAEVEQQKEEAQDADFEVVDDEQPEAEAQAEKPISDPGFSEEYGVELPDWDKDSSIPANGQAPDAPEAQEGQDQAGEPGPEPEKPKPSSSFEKARAAYFVTWKQLTDQGIGDTPALGELMPPDELATFRADWQEEHIGKRSASHFSEEEFRKGREMLREGIGLYSPSVADSDGGDLPI